MNDIDCQLVVCMLIMVVSTGCVHASNGNINWLCAC